MTREQQEEVRKALEAHFGEPVQLKSDGFYFNNKKCESNNGDFIGSIAEGSDDSEIIFGCCPQDCNVDDFWKGDLTEARGALTQDQLTDIDGKTFAGIVFVDGYFE